MGSKKKGMLEVLKIETNYLLTMTSLVRPIVNGYDALLAIAETDPIMNGKLRKRLGARAKKVEDEMIGMIGELRPAKHLNPQITSAILAAAINLKSKAALIESACRTGNFQAMKWNSAFSMFADIAHAGEHNMNMIDNAFAQDAPGDVRAKIMDALEAITKKWRVAAHKTFKKLEAKAA